MCPTICQIHCDVLYTVLSVLLIRVIQTDSRWVRIVRINAASDSLLSSPTTVLRVLATGISGASY